MFLRILFIHVQKCLGSKYQTIYYLHHLSGNFQGNSHMILHRSTNYQIESLSKISQQGIGWGRELPWPWSHFLCERRAPIFSYHHLTISWFFWMNWYLARGITRTRAAILYSASNLNGSFALRNKGAGRIHGSHGSMQGASKRAWPGGKCRIGPSDHPWPAL